MPEMINMQERNNRNIRSSSMKNARKTRKYSNGSADNPFENYANGRKQSQSTFTKILTLMVIVFLTAIFAILLFANNQEILSKSLGEHSLLSSILSKYGEIINNGFLFLVCSSIPFLGLI